jgi:hemerythrin
LTVKWGDFNTGIKEIDIHHEGMFEKINELLNAIEQGVEMATLRKQIIFLKLYYVSFHPGRSATTKVCLSRLRISF